MARTTPQPAGPFAHFRLDFSPMRKRRRQLNLSQRQLAQAIGVHTITIYRTESNRSEPTYKQMVAIGRALGVPQSLLVNVMPLDEAPDGRA